MRETESALQQSAEYVLKHRLAHQTAAPYFVRWVRQFLARGAAARPRGVEPMTRAPTRARTPSPDPWRPSSLPV